VLTACPNPAPVITDAGQPETCGTGTVLCSCHCVNTLQDGANCGVCGRACAGAQSCAGGSCYANTCADSSCGASQVCVGLVCLDRACVGVSCASDQVCVSGTCQSSLCNGVACPTGLACLGGTCTDLNCQGVTCPVGKTCQLGACVGAGAGAAVHELSSGGSFGEQQQTNADHINRAVLGEPTPPVDGVKQTNATHVNQGGFATGMQKP
jgi:hypothetical protein